MSVRLETQAEPIPGYKLVERLGGGGFGEVWKAIAPGGIFKAIKFVYGDLDTISDEGQRAKQELKALSRVKTVRHPYILSLERFDIIDGQLIIVMELADRNLWDRFRECTAEGLAGIPRDELLRYMEEAAEALDLMNIQYQLQHIDIKPQNLFLVHNHAKVADFGLVKDLEGRMASVTGGVTPVYAAPETFDGWISRYCDQYSLAIVYQELLTGRRPFTGTSLRQLILQHLQASPNLSSLPAGDREAIGRSLSKNPDDRFPTCLDLVRALQSSGADHAIVVKSMQDTHHETGADTTELPSAACREDATRQRVPSADEGAERAIDASAELQQPAAKTRWINLQENRQRREEELFRARRVPEEAQGDGILFPALVLGLGQLGLGVLHRLRRKIHTHVGPIEKVPSIRLLYMDTDPESLRRAAKVDSAAALTPHEVLVTKLNRPSHYLRSKEERKQIDPWFDLKMLYRIPRTLVTTGLRALGRLAFFDNYRVINRRLSNELQACTFAENLAAAIQNTGLGLRSNRPKVYVVTGLAGGTGSGAFLDLAYLLRKLIRDLGYDRPQIIGIFLLPEVDRHPSRTLAVGNAFAALTELNHFSSPKNVFTASYTENEKPLVDAEAPYSRCIVLPLPEATDDQATRQTLNMTAEHLLRELVTPMGRAVDDREEDVPNYSPSTHTLLCQTFGLRQIAWPRRALIGSAARRLCQGVVEHWMSKDANSVRETVRQSLAELAQSQQLDGEHLIAKLERVCAKTFGESADGLFERITGPLARLDGQDVDACITTLSETLAQIEQVVGRPEGVVGSTSVSLGESLSEAAEAMTAALGKVLSQFAIQLIEQPEYRLAGAEEAARQMIVNVEQILRHYEPLNKELAARTGEAYSQIKSGLAAIQTATATSRKLPAMINAVAEVVRVYPKWRLQNLVLQRVVGVFICLRGELSDQLRELNFCRGRLGELQKTLQSSDADPLFEEELAVQHTLFPGNCHSLREATEVILGAITPEEIQGLDHRMQAVLRDQFSALSHVCLSSSNLIPSVREAMQCVAEAYVTARLAETRITEMFFERHDTEEQAENELAALFDDAAPELASKRIGTKREVCVLAVPNESASSRLVEMVQHGMAGINWTVTGSKEGVIFYRELQEIKLSELEQLSPVAYEAYQQMTALEHFTPHSRSDINEWQVASA
jgi:hypothetical protein